MFRENLPPFTNENATTTTPRKHALLVSDVTNAGKSRPLLTKSVTAAVVSALGEVAGSALRPPSPSAPAAPPGAARALVARPGAGPAPGAAGGASPGLLRRTAAFALFGLVLNGPVFHWWYGALERAAARYVDYAILSYVCTASRIEQNWACRQKKGVPYVCM